MASTRLDQVVLEEHGPLHYMPWSLSRPSLAQRRWLSTSVAFLHLPVDPNKYGLNASFNRGMKRISHSYKQSYTYLEYSNSKYHLFGFEAPRSFGWIGKNKHIETENCVTQVILLFSIYEKKCEESVRGLKMRNGTPPTKMAASNFRSQLLARIPDARFSLRQNPVGIHNVFQQGHESS